MIMPNDISISKCLPISVFVLDIVLVCLLAIECYYWQLEVRCIHTRIIGGTNTSFTIPCDDVSLSLDEDNETFDSSKKTIKYFVDAKQRNVCSFTNLTEIVEKAVERHSRIRLAKGLSAPMYMSCGNPSAAPKPGDSTAYFTKLSSHQTFKDEGRNQIIHWDHHQNKSYIGPGLIYHNGKIHVNETRYYFTYASVTFNQTVQDYQDCGSCLFTLSIVKANPSFGDFEVTQLSNTQMLCKTNGISTTYVGSHVHLDRDDVIYVKISDASRLVYKSSGNVFGIFPMA